MPKKYANVEELATAYKSGELDRSDAPLVIDNDSTSVYVDEDCVFEEHPVDLLVAALNALGIPSEPA